MNKYLIFLFIHVIAYPTVYGVQLTFSDLNINEQDIVIYHSNGSKYWEGKSNGTVYINESLGDYIIVFKPRNVNIFQNPLIAVDYLQSYIPLLFTIGLILGMLYMFLSFLRKWFK